MGNEIIMLLKETKARNDLGDPVVTTCGRPVFAALKSIGQSEFYQAQAAGYRPEIKFVLEDFLDYEGEKYLKYEPYNGEPQIYEVVRTYRTGNALEIVAQRGVDT